MVTLAQVKNALCITGTFQDSTLQEYFDEVVAFLKDAGVPEANMTSGIIARGVSDLWNYGGGGGSLSRYFMIRAIQLAAKLKLASMKAFHDSVIQTVEIDPEKAFEKILSDVAVPTE